MKKKQSDFHHGNLRAALLQAAFEILDEAGPDAITIREVARRSGVSHAAPVNHFKNRTELLTVVATILFRELDSAISAKLQTFPTTPADCVRSFANTLIAFGLEHPNRYQLLWRRDLVDNSDADLQAAMDGIYDKLISAIDLSKNKTRFDKHTFAIAIWSLAHGYVTMRLNQNFEPMNDSITGQSRQDAIIEAVILSLGT
ncbi:TetR/AcrR family transcriptional regulator [Parasphingorhabdus sp.]|uniref:TetR/AcrR family transcriptional regulator n=1 Tax=Parasphingorhabdus sp. TaxID=2709688 RepID=UPI003593A2F3